MITDPAHTLTLCRRLLDERGYRMTVGRHAVVSVLAEAVTGEHLSADDIYVKVHGSRPSVGLTSVYRTLDLLVHLGVVNKFDFGDGRARYELAEVTHAVTHHHHLVCTACGKIVDYDDFADEELRLLKRTEEALSEKYGFKITSHMVRFHGLCSQCTAKERQVL